MYARLVGLSLEPFVQVLDSVGCFLVPQRHIRYDFKTKNLLLACVQQGKVLVAGAPTPTAVRHSPESFSSSTTTAAAALAVGHPRQGLAWLYAGLVGPTVEFVVHGLDFVVCSLIPQLEIRMN